jgi:hypothetical protein
MIAPAAPAARCAARAGRGTAWARASCAPKPVISPKERIVANDERETELIFRTMRNTSRLPGTRSDQGGRDGKGRREIEDGRELVAGARGKMVRIRRCR